MQMQGLLKKLSSFESHIQGLKAGLDMLCIGNNLIAEDGAAVIVGGLHPRMTSVVADSRSRPSGDDGAV